MNGARPPAQPVLPCGADARAVRRDIASASDRRVLEVVRLLEALPDRSIAEGLLAPLRGRLRVLRPPRHICFPRLLCVPLEPVLRNAREWRPTDVTAPRSVVAPMVAALRRALPELAVSIDRMIDDQDQPEALRVAVAGKALWEAAGAALRLAAVPAEWRETSLPEAVFHDLKRAMGAVLGMAWRLHGLSDPATPLCEQNQALAALLGDAEQHGPLAWGMCLTVMLQRFPRAEAPRRAAGAMRADRTMRQAAEFATEACWLWIDASAASEPDCNLQEAADILHRQSALLEALAADPAHRKRAVALQLSLRAASAAQFETALQERMLAPIQAMTPAMASNDTALGVLEQDARDLRRFDIEARRLGGAAALDSRLAAVAAAVGRQPDMAPMDRARLVEILLGAQAAQRLLAKGMA